jgi:hypothetical protein
MTGGFTMTKADIRASVKDGRIIFSPAYALEAAVLAHGPKSARKLLNKRMAALKTDGMPAIAPTSREEAYERAYALIRELGRAIGAELKRLGCELPLGGMVSATLAGFEAAARGGWPPDPPTPGAEALTARGAWAAAATIISVFPKKKRGPEPDFDETVRAFWRGVTDATGPDLWFDETGGSRDGQ